VIPPDPHNGRGRPPPAPNTQPGPWPGAGRKRAGVGTQTLVPLNFSYFVAPLHIISVFCNSVTAAGFVFHKGMSYMSVIVQIFRAVPREHGMGRCGMSTDFCIFKRFMCEIDCQICKCIQLSSASGPQSFPRTTDNHRIRPSKFRLIDRKNTGKQCTITEDR